MDNNPPVAGSNAERSLERVFDPRLNGLNALRLALALSVIVWHSFPLSGSTIEFAPLRQFLSEAGVDGFFAISGFLIVGSWKRNPDWFRFIAARVLRIFPAFWLCLVVTAFAIAPLATTFVSQSSFGGALSIDNVTYVLRNFALRIFQPDIDGTPTGVPFPGSWNGSLWTLWWEFLCYLFVLALGILGAYRFRLTVPATLVGSIALLAVIQHWEVTNFYLENVARFGVMFAAGMLIEQYSHRLVVSWTWIVVALLITVASLWLPDYRLVGGLLWAYALIGGGALVKVRALRLRNDVSYGTYIYAFPLQQLLASLGAEAIGVVAFALASILATIPLALGSWFLVERRALRLRPRANRRRRV